MDQFHAGGFVLHGLHDGGTGETGRRGEGVSGAAVVGTGAGVGDGRAAGMTVSAPAGATVGELQRFLSARGYAQHLFYFIWDH